MAERWTRLANRDWIEYLDSDVAAQDAREIAAAKASTSSSSASVASELYESDSEGDRNARIDGTRDSASDYVDSEEEDLTGSDSAQSSTYANDSACGSDNTSISTGPYTVDKQKAATQGSGSTNSTVQAPDVAEPPPLPPLKGKSREGQKRKWQIGHAPVELLAGFSSEAVAQIVVGRYRCNPEEGRPPKVGPVALTDQHQLERHWASGTTCVSKAWGSKGPLYLFLAERAAGWLPINAVDPIIFNNMSPLMHRFTLNHMEAVASYLNLPPLPPPAKKGRQSASIQDFLWRTFLGTNEEETSSLPSTIKEAICGMILESWRRTVHNEPFSLDSPFCPHCTSLICTSNGQADFMQSLTIFMRESAKLRRATAPLRLYSSKAPTCTCTTCKKALAKTQAAVNKWVPAA